MYWLHSDHIEMKSQRLHSGQSAVIPTYYSLICRKVARVHIEPLRSRIDQNETGRIATRWIRSPHDCRKNRVGKQRKEGRVVSVGNAFEVVLFGTGREGGESQR